MFELRYSLPDKSSRTEKYINSITFSFYKMALTETIPTKFPRHDVIVMDKLIQRGIFISRSDLIREAAREKIQESTKAQTYGDILVKKMKEEGDFNKMEWKTLVNLYLKPNLKESSMDEAEKRATRKLLRDPMGLLKKKNGRLEVTENGESIVRGYIKGLLHSQIQ